MSNKNNRFNIASIKSTSAHNMWKETVYISLKFEDILKHIINKTM